MEDSGVEAKVFAMISVENMAPYAQEVLMQGIQVEVDSALPRTYPVPDTRAIRALAPIMVDQADKILLVVEIEISPDVNSGMRAPPINFIREHKGLSTVLAGDNRLGWQKARLVWISNSR